MRDRQDRYFNGIKRKQPSKSDRSAKAARETLDGVIGEMFMSEIKKKYRLDRDAYKNSPDGKREQARAAVLQELDRRIQTADNEILKLIKKFKDEVVSAILEELDLTTSPRKVLTVGQIKTIILAYEDHIRLIEEICKITPLKSGTKYTQYELLFSELMKHNYLFVHFAPKSVLTKKSPHLSFVPKQELPYIKQLFDENDLIGSQFYKSYCATFLDHVDCKKLDIYSLQPEKHENYFTDEKIQERRSMLDNFELALDEINQQKINATHDFIDDTVGLIICDASSTSTPLSQITKRYHINFKVLKSLYKKMDFKGEDIVETLKREIISGLQPFITTQTTDESSSILD